MRALFDASIMLDKIREGLFIKSSVSEDKIIANQILFITYFYSTCVGFRNEFVLHIKECINLTFA